VIGEAFSGLTAVVDAVALRLDSVLRPAFGPITNKLFNLADSIAQADGKMGLFVDTVIVIATVLGTIAGVIATVSAAASIFAGTFATIASVGGTIITVLGSLGAAILSLPVLLAAAIAALAAFAIAYITNWKGTRDKTNAIIGEIVSFVTSGFDELVTIAGNKFDALVSKAKGWGKSLMERFIAGIKSMVGNLRNAVGNTEIAAGVSVNDITRGASSAVSGATEGASDFIGSVGDGATSVYLDGTSIEDNQGRIRKDGLTRRGG
jgi:hypothetical protein